MNLENLAKIAGIRFRDVPVETQGFVYDGETLAVQYTTYDWSYDWSDPKPIGVGDYTFHDTLHEIVHALVAWDWQLKLPHYGLNWYVVSHASGPQAGLAEAYGLDAAHALVEGCVEEWIQNAQEAATQRLVVELALRYFPDSPTHIGPKNMGSWREYRLNKREEEVDAGYVGSSGWRLFYDMGVKKLRQKGVYVPFSHDRDVYYE